MRKFITVGLATLGALALIFILLFSSVEIVINDETFINNEFTKLGVNKSMGMSNEDLVRSMTRLIDYMEGEAPDIRMLVTVNGEQKEMFEIEQEVSHMADVRTLYQNVRGLRDLAIPAMFICFLLAAIIHFSRTPQTLAQGYLSGAFIAMLFLGLIGTWALMDFSSFWTFFHETLFWNDMWLFDPAESRMINMMPEQLFADIVGKIFLYAGIVLGVLLVLSIVTLVVSSDKYKQKKAELKKARRERERKKQEAYEAREKARIEEEKARRIAIRKAEREAKLAAREELLAKKEAKERARAERLARAKAQVEREVAAMDTDPDTYTETDAYAEADAEPAPQKRTPKKRTKKVTDDTGFLDD